MSVSCECCVLSVRSLCVRMITLPEESTECGVSECDTEMSVIRRTWPTTDCKAMIKTINIHMSPLSL